MREEKKLLLDEIKEKVKLSKSLIIAKYENVKSQETWDLRKLLEKTSTDMEIVKKRILLKVLKTCGYSYELSELEGHIAVFFIKEDDPINATKVIFDFENETNKLSVLKGEINGKSYNKQDMIILSKLPPLNELRAEFLGLLEAPMAQTVSVMNTLLTGVIYAIEEKKKLEEKK